jgi:hypothetical protein
VGPVLIPCAIPFPDAIAVVRHDTLAVAQADPFSLPNLVAFSGGNAGTSLQLLPNLVPLLTLCLGGSGRYRCCKEADQKKLFHMFTVDISL